MSWLRWHGGSRCRTNSNRIERPRIFDRARIGAINHPSSKLGINPVCAGGFSDFGTYWAILTALTF
jgi:hypothetical protein